MFTALEALTDRELDQRDLAAAALGDLLRGTLPEPAPRLLVGRRAQLCRVLGRTCLRRPGGGDDIPLPLLLTAHQGEAARRLLEYVVQPRRGNRATT